MIQTLKLLLPALIPSWRFFDWIAPSPRIEFALLGSAQDTPDNWQEFRPRTAHLPLSRMLTRMFWNPRWNESLFLVSCAERIMESADERYIREIAQRIKVELMQNRLDAYFQFRLVFVSRKGAALQTHTTFTSPIYPLRESAVS